MAQKAVSVDHLTAAGIVVCFCLPRRSTRPAGAGLPRSAARLQCSRVVDVGGSIVRAARSKRTCHVIRPLIAQSEHAMVAIVLDSVEDSDEGRLHKLPNPKSLLMDYAYAIPQT